MPVGGPIRHARQCTRTCSSPGNTTLPARCPPGLSARSASPRFNLSASARAADHAASASREAPRGGVSKFLWIAWGPSPQGPGWAAPSSGGHRGQGTSVSQGGPQCHGRTGAKCCAPLPRAVRLGKCTRTPTRTHTHTLTSTQCHATLPVPPGPRPPPPHTTQMPPSPGVKDQPRVPLLPSCSSMAASTPTSRSSARISSRSHTRGGVTANLRKGVPHRGTQGERHSH
jgi:hypothetical protein